jgi:hypothetical protein
MQFYFIYLEQQRERWVNKAAIDAMPFTTKVTTLLLVFGMFYDTAINLDKIWQSEFLKEFYDTMISRADPAFKS